MARGTQTDRKPEHVEQLLDKMSKDSFPASDPPQLEGFTTDGAPAHNAVPPPTRTHAPPPDVGALPGSEASPFDRDGSYPVGDAGEVKVRTKGHEVTIELPANPLTVDAATLETLISVLERHRPPLHPATGH
jgi:hypothetical protein